MQLRTDWMLGASGPGVVHIDSSFFRTPFVPFVAENPCRSMSNAIGDNSSIAIDVFLTLLEHDLSFSRCSGYRSQPADYSATTTARRRSNSVALQWKSTGNFASSIKSFASKSCKRSETRE